MLFSCTLVNLLFMSFRQVNGNKSPIIHDSHILLGFIVLKKFCLLLLLFDLFFIINININTIITVTIAIKF